MPGVVCAFEKCSPLGTFISNETTEYCVITKQSSRLMQADKQRETVSAKLIQSIDADQFWCLSLSFSVSMSLSVCVSAEASKHIIRLHGEQCACIQYRTKI